MESITYTTSPCHCGAVKCAFEYVLGPCYGEIHPADDGGEEGPTNITHTCDGHEENGKYTPRPATQD
jgi:hypothetical protein